MARLIIWMASSLWEGKNGPHGPPSTFRDVCELSLGKSWTFLLIRINILSYNGYLYFRNFSRGAEILGEFPYITIKFTPPRLSLLYYT